MNTTVSRSINYGNKQIPFSFTGSTMSEQQYKLKDCANKLSITPERYLNYLEFVNEHPIIGPIGKTLFVKENVHRKVEKLFDKQTQPVNEVNDEKDFKLVQHQIEKKLKKDFTISNKRNTAKFYSPAKVKEWESLVEEINKYFRDIHFIDEKLGIETIYAGFLKHYKFNYDPLQKIPVLRFKKHSRYGHELYLEFFINQDLKTDGVKNLKRKIFRVSGDLNNISDAESLYSYVIRFAFSIFLKIKAGYYVTYTPNVRSMKFSEIEKLPIGKHYLIPTLYAYLEHFYEKRTYKKGQYDTIKSDLNTLVKYIHKLPRKLPIDLTKLEHTVKFLDFDKVSGIKFLEYLQINKDTKTGEPIVGITIKNIFSSLGNLMNKVKEYRNDLLRLNHVNPFEKQNITKSKSKRHVTLTLEQLALLEDKMIEKGETQLLHFVNFLYLTGIRPVEAKRLQVKHLNDFRSALNLPSEITKNGQPRSIKVGEYFKNIINEMGYKNFPANFFIFSNNGAIGEIPTGKNYFSRKFKEIRLKCDDLTPFYTLYSYRHTFALNFMMEPLENENNEDKRFELMGVLGHSKFETTEIYLKGFPKELVSKSKWQGMKHWRQK